MLELCRQMERGRAPWGLLGCLVRCVARARQPPATSGCICLPSTPLTAKMVALGDLGLSHKHRERLCSLVVCRVMWWLECDLSDAQGASWHSGSSPMHT